jgi:hypothetical protein
MSVTATANHETTKVEATEATIVWIEEKKEGMFDTSIVC